MSNAGLPTVFDLSSKAEFESSPSKNRILLATPRGTLTSAIQEDYTRNSCDISDVISQTPEYAILLSKVVDSAETDKLSKALLDVTYHHKTTIKLLYGLIRNEFSSNQINTILRGNSIATKVETSFCRKVGRGYLKTLFGDIILRLVTDIDLNLATTINKLDEEEAKKGEIRIEENRQRILDVAQEFVNRFTSTEMVELMPRPIRAIAYFTCEFAQKFTHDLDFQFIGGFILLRFFNPAIITPEALEMLPPEIIPTPRDRQNLIAITRLLQKLSNKVLTSNAEEQNWVNPFIERNCSKINSYISQLIMDPLGKQFQDLLKEDSDISLDSHGIDPKNIEYLHSLLYEHGSFLVQEFTKYPPIKGAYGEVELSSEFLRLMFRIGSPRKNLRTLSIFKKNDAQWLPPLPLNKKVSARFGHTIAVRDHFAYFFGGSDVNGLSIVGEDALVVYNLCTAEWSCQGHGSDHPYRKYHSALFWKDSMLIYGGVQNRESVSDMYEYNIKTKQWSKVVYANDPPLPRHGHSMNMINDDVYIFGGYCFDGKKYSYSNSLYKFNMETKLWSEVESHNRPSERMYHSSFIHKNSIWIFGGKNSDMSGINDFYRYDIPKKTWKKVSCRGKIPSSRWGHSLAMVNDQCVVLYGGCNEQNVFSDAYEFQFGSQTWREIQSVNNFGVKPPPMAQHSSTAYMGKIIIFFGGTYTQTGTLSSDLFELILDKDFIPQNGLSESMKKLLFSPHFSDISFQVQNYTVHAHKLVLYARCSKLYSLVSELSSYSFDHLSLNVLLFILNFIYTGDLSNNFLYTFHSLQNNHPNDINYINATNYTPSFLIDCLEICFMLDLTQLIRIIELRLIDIIQLNCLVELFHVAEKYNLRVLEISCVMWLVHSEAVSDFPFHNVSNRLKHLIAMQFFPEKNSAYPPLNKNNHNHNHNHNNNRDSHSNLTP